MTYMFEIVVKHDLVAGGYRLPAGLSVRVPYDQMSSPLKDKQLFSQFRLDGWTVSWQTGRLDIAPEYLYAVGTPA